MTTLPNASDSQGAGVLDQPCLEDQFTPDVHFGEWLQAVESFRNRSDATTLPGAYLEKGDLNFEDALSRYDHLEKKISSQGILVVTEHGKLQADVEVTVAMIDGALLMHNYFAVTRSACSACKACTRTFPRCRAAIPSAAARAAESVVMVVMRPVTAARRIAFSSK